MGPSRTVGHVISTALNLLKASYGKSFRLSSNLLTMDESLSGHLLSIVDLSLSDTIKLTPNASDKAAYCVFTQFLGPENAIKFISVRTKTQ